MEPATLLVRIQDPSKELRIGLRAQAEEIRGARADIEEAVPAGFGAGDGALEVVFDRSNDRSELRALGDVGRLVELDHDRRALATRVECQRYSVVPSMVALHSA